MKDDLIKTARDKIDGFSAFLGTKKWFAGDNVRKIQY